MTKPKRRLTAPEFDALVPLLGISEDRINAARLALVDGQTYQAIGNIYACSRQAVGDSVDVVWKTYEKYNEAQRTAASSGALLPPGWEQVTLIAPTALIAKFRAEIAQAAPVPQKVAVAKKAPAKKTARRPAKA